MSKGKPKPIKRRGERSGRMHLVVRGTVRHDAPKTARIRNDQYPEEDK